MSRNERKYCFRVRHVPWEGVGIYSILDIILCFCGISLMRTLCNAYYEED